MGEVSELIQDGILCDQCGGFIGKEKLESLGVEFDGNDILTSPGYPISCDDCE